MADRKAQLGLTDMSFNAPIFGRVSGKGNTQHREFAMASGGMSREEFTRFLTDSSLLISKNSADAALGDATLARLLSELKKSGVTKMRAGSHIDETNQEVVWSIAN
jgi:hypothetical protein